jgi:D-3-phosphoglycerate dehydrogenase
MARWGHLKDFRIIRLNATLMPVHPAEAAMYRRYNLNPVQVEANTPEEIIPYVADCDALFAVSVALPLRVIESLTRCRLISRLGAGTDKIDVAAATRKGIIVSNVPFFCVEEMADHAMAMLLSLARKIPQMSRDMYAGAYRHARMDAIQLRRLSGCVLGLVGFGASGQAVARRAKAFGLRVLATRRDMNASRRAADELGVEIVDLDTLLAQSDFVSLHLPLNAETYHLLDDAALRKMKPGAYLINTSRGAIVDETALATLLREGRLAGAGLEFACRC